MSTPTGPTPSGGVRIRPERADDPAEVAEIGRLHDAAFGDPLVAPLVLAIRASSEYRPSLSLVADKPDLPGAPIVGHIMLSGTELVAASTAAGPVLADTAAGRVPILILSPLGVLPAEQNRGIGVALSRAALSLADARREPLVVVQGHPGYYPRFGFVRGRTIGVVPPENLGPIDQAWMARRRPGPESGIRGRVVYPKAFLDLDS